MSEFADIISVIIAFLALLISAVTVYYARETQRNSLIHSLSLQRLTIWNKKQGEKKNIHIERIGNFYEYITFLVSRGEIDEIKAKELFLDDIKNLFDVGRSVINRNNSWKYLKLYHTKWTTVNPSPPVHIRTPNNPIHNPLIIDSTGWTILGIFSFIILSILIYFIFKQTSLLGSLEEILKNNLGSLIVDNLWVNLKASILITFLIFGLIVTLNLSFIKLLKKIKVMTIVTLSLMCLLFFFGMFSINEVIGYNPIKFNLIEDIPGPLVRYSGTVECRSDEAEIYFANDPIRCEYKPNIEFKDISTNTRFKVENYSFINLTDHDLNVTFIAPEKGTHAYFELSGIDTNNNQRYLSVSYPYKFLTRDEYEKNKQLVLTAIISLLILILVTVPSAVINIREIWNKN